MAKLTTVIHSDEDVDSVLDPAPFHATGPSYTYDAVWLARGITVALAAVDPAQPAVQLEFYDDGVLIVGTDSYSLLRAWVPTPEHSATGTKLTGNPPPELDDEPDGVYTVTDADGALAQWAKFYGKAARAKAHPVDPAPIDFGKLDTPEPTLSPDLDPVGVRFGGASAQAVLPAGLGALYDWRNVARHVEQAPRSDRPVLLGGRRAVQLGQIANAVGDEQAFKLQPRLLAGTESAVIVVDYDGFPPVSGYIASPRPADDD